MSRPVICTLGWQLDHTAIEAVDLAETARIAHCDALFLAAGSLANLWHRAVGHPVRSFRSASHERKCWRTLAAFGQQLRRLLRGGGVLLVRLDRPEDMCRVTCRPDDPRLPVGSPIDVYDALASADPLLTAVARDRRLLSNPTVGPLRTTTAKDLRQVFSPYLQQTSQHAFASLALVGIDDHAEPLLMTAEGDCVAAASGQIVLLPPMGMLDPRQEASCLLATLDGLMIGRRGERWTPIIQEPRAGDSVLATTLATAVDEETPKHGLNLVDWVLTSDERAVLSSH